MKLQALRSAKASVTMELSGPWLCWGTGVGYMHSLVDVRLALPLKLPRRCLAGPVIALQAGPLCCMPHSRRTGLVSRPLSTEVEVCTEPVLAQLQAKRIEGLNGEQMLAVTSNASCIRVSAGPGSGKTRVLTHRIAHLVQDRGVSASQILAITFTNKAAGEIGERLQSLMPNASKMPTTGTFHSVCARILRRDAHLLDLGITRNFVIYDEKDSQNLLKKICEQVLSASNQAKSTFQYTSPSSSEFNSKTEKETKDVDDEMAEHLLRLIGPFQHKLKRNGLSPKILKDISGKVMAIKERNLDRFISKRRRGTVGPEKRISDEYLFTRLANLYEAGLRSNNAVDFDDLLGLTVRLLHSQPSVLEYYRNRWTHVLVDEFQDTNQVQYEFVRLLCSTNKNLFVVGDVDQSIYGWRGADFRNMETYLTSHFSEVVTYQLRKNYRSSANIVNLASFVIKYGRKKVPALEKTYVNGECTSENDLEAIMPPGRPVTICTVDGDRDEAQFVKNEILKYVGDGKRTWGGCAIMFRARAQKDAVEEALLQASIPFRITGEIDFFQHKEIKDLQSYMMLVLDMNNELALTRVINIPPRGIGAKTIDTIRKWGSAKGLSFSRAVQTLKQELPSKEEVGITAVSRSAVLKFCDLIDDLRSLSQSARVSDVIECIVARTDYVTYLNNQKEEKEKTKQRLENIQQFKMLADAEEESGNDQNNLAEFLQNCTLFTRGSSEKEDVVKLMTLHAAKGLEFDCVFLIGLEEGRFPVATFGERLDEERRLFYVGLTRAQKHLYLISKTKGFNREYQEEVELQPSRFISEILRSQLPLEGNSIMTLDCTKLPKSPAHVSIHSDYKMRRQ